MSEYKAILFDMDGVLIESEGVMAKSGILALRDFGISATAEDFVPFVGRGEDRYMGGVAEKYGLQYDPAMKYRCYEYYSQLIVSEAPVPERLQELLLYLKDRGYKLAVCTSADESKALDNLRAIGLGKDFFDVFITAELITNKKPDPEIYLKARDMLGLESEDCLVVEDAPSGIQAAHAGGMQAVGVITSFTEEYLREEANPEQMIHKLIELKDIL